MPVLNELSGLWRRSLIEWPDGRRDTTTKVQWLQGVGAFGDLRQPALLKDFSHARDLSDLSRDDCESLSQQQAFAGDLTVVGNYFEWTRVIDYQPAGLFADAGSLRWDGDVLIEEGRDVAYTEHWHRDADGETDGRIAGVQWQNKRTGVIALLVRSGTTVMYARDRRVALSKRRSLSECLADADGITQVRAMLDCEISFASTVATGTAAPTSVRIYSSTLPFRVGAALQQPKPDEWELIKCEGFAAALEVF